MNDSYRTSYIKKDHFIALLKNPILVGNVSKCLSPKHSSNKDETLEITKCGALKILVVPMCHPLLYPQQDHHSEKDNSWFYNLHYFQLLQFFGPNDQLQQQ